MRLRGALILGLCAALSLAPPAPAAPDSTTGGVEVPSAPTGGTEGGAFPTPADEGPDAGRPPAPAAGSPLHAAQAAPSQAPAQGGGEDPDVDVDVPVPPQQQPQPAPPAQPAAPEGGGGLASTGFAAGVLALLGFVFGAAGLTLLRMSAPARLRRRAERRAA